MAKRQGYDDGNGPRVRGAVTPNKSRLAYSATLGIFIIGAALLCACGEDEYAGGPIGPVNPNDPHPVWCFADSLWFKFDQNGNQLLRLTFPGENKFFGEHVNPDTGDIWALKYYLNDPCDLLIYDENGGLKKNLGKYGDGVQGGVGSDTKRDVVWFCYQNAASDSMHLVKSDYAGNILVDKEIPGPYIESYASKTIRVYENTGDVWLFDDLTCRVRKFDANGNLLFIKQPSGFGVPYVNDMHLDPTDGGVWLGVGDLDYSNYLLKVDAAGNPVRELHVFARCRLMDVGRRTGAVLIKRIVKEGDYLELYDRYCRLVWSRRLEKQYFTGAISDFDGGAWFGYSAKGGSYLGKVDLFGNDKITGINIEDYPGAFRVEVKNDPYPYD